MKRLTQSIVTTALLLTLSSAVVATPPRPPQPPVHHHYHGGGHLDWLGALLLIGVTAAIVNAVTQPPAPQPPKPVVPAPVEPFRAQPLPQYIEEQPVAGTWYYFCRSENMYYPYVRSCPEEWELIPTVPQQ